MPGINVARLGGHCPIFPFGMVYKIYPKKAVIRHYNIRNKQQAENKIQDRIRRISHSSSRSSIISHLVKTSPSDYSSAVDHRILTKYNEDNQWNYELKFTPNIRKRITRQDLLSHDGLLKFEF